MPPASLSRKSPLLAAEAHAEGFVQVREARRSELVEDYVELIADLIADGFLMLNAGRLIATDQGRPVLDGVLKALLT